jgi:hypothetical protein
MPQTRQRTTIASAVANYDPYGGIQGSFGFTGDAERAEPLWHVRCSERLFNGCYVWGNRRNMNQ